MYDFPNPDPDQLANGSWLAGREAHHGQGQPSALYYGEPRVHVMMLAVVRLFATQQFKEPLNVETLLVDPIVGVDAKRSSTWHSKTPPSRWRSPTSQDLSEWLSAYGVDSLFRRAYTGVQNCDQRASVKSRLCHSQGPSCYVHEVDCLGVCPNHIIAGNIYLL